MQNLENGRLLSWAVAVDPKTLEQAAGLLKLPFIFPHLALMADTHLGKGAPIGTVMPTLGAVVPAAVGVDIGCGMIAVRTNAKFDDFGDLDLVDLRTRIQKVIPLSPGNYNPTVVRTSAQERIAQLEDLADLNKVDLSHSPKWREQLGSLGGGNHFLELCLDEDDDVWLFLHSGSRGVGNKIAQKHIKIAQELCKLHHIELADRDHAYLSEGTPEFDQYLRELHWAQDFAKLNRDEMMDRFFEEFSEWIGATVTERQRINTHHNYTTKVSIHNKSVWLTRKGAIDASEGTWGLIPGSMGTGSYVVTGKGNPAALYSAPHGAGRLFSRTKARELFTEADLNESMKGIVFVPGAEFIDEIPGAYKKITDVIAASEDQVNIEYVLRQILNVKGT